jgi:hypothetical protein
MKEKRKQQLIEARIERKKSGFKIWVKSPDLGRVIKDLSWKTGKLFEMGGAVGYTVDKSDLLKAIKERITSRNNIGRRIDLAWSHQSEFMFEDTINLAYLFPEGIEEGVELEFDMPTTNTTLKKITEILHCAAFECLKEHHTGFKGEVSLFVEEE